ncbi:prenyltransferase/squalene oxidase repeat-containing protein [Streptomyces sp. NPDC048361]|uniref:prenyltransferase/squalene oxidase repeat-containing protein n=1 Tax=Streptomyces sp. NPDC048361 TaxID=3154720 RepID=UPI0034267096
MTAPTVSPQAGLTTISAVPSPPGGAVLGEPDLWCTYAAIRTLAWLGRAADATAPDATARYLAGRRNADGGYAWSVGMPSDAWATFYCTQALTDLGRPVPEPETTAAWLATTWTGDAYAMTPGQDAEVWATHFSTRTTLGPARSTVPDRERLLAWLRGLQTEDGGLSWSPGHTTADVRACHYGAAAWAALNAQESVRPPWDVPRLVAWLQAQQAPEGGFRFSPDAGTPCMWATYRSVAALRILDAMPTYDIEPWVRALRGPGRAFVRWEGYPVEDVWASFCAVGALVGVGAEVSDIADDVVRRIAELACTDGGYTYREPALAADALTTAAAVLTRPEDPAVPAHRAWLEGCRLPNEAGLMYMPGRGSEIRCTLWGLTAGAFADPERHAEQRAGVLDWLRSLQNPDGGFGFWEGRGSDSLSTAAAVAVVRLLDADVSVVLDDGALETFTTRSPAEGARARLRVLRVRHALGHLDDAPVRDVLDAHRVRGGGWADTGSRMPDLLSTYEAVATADLFGIAIDPEHLRRFVDRVHTTNGTAWTPLAPATGGPLAACLGALLRRRVEQGPTGSLPDLVLS